MTDRSLNLLIVDDEETFAGVLAMHLRDTYGYKTSVAYSGREAIAKIKTDSTGFDVILLDYKMPDLNGLNVLQWMLEEKNTTPVIMLTAAGSEQVAVEALKLGAYDYVRKELIDVAHIDILIRGVNERHLFRVAEALEQEKQGEMAMNNYATDLVRLVMNAVTPKLNTTLAQLSTCAEIDPKEVLSRIPVDQRESLQKIFSEILEHTQKLDIITNGILHLFQHLYAHHSELTEIENIKHWFQKNLQIKQESVQPHARVIETTAAKEVGQSAILVIDDDEMMLSALKTLLEDERYSVTTVNDGYKGYQLYKQHRYDIVLLDLKLPSVAGLDILQEIMEFDAEARVIIITGFSSAETAEEARNLGAIGFYEKSRDVEELVSMIQQAVVRNARVATKSSS